MKLTKIFIVTIIGLSAFSFTMFASAHHGKGNGKGNGISASSTSVRGYSNTRTPKSNFVDKNNDGVCDNCTSKSTTSTKCTGTCWRI